MAKLPIVNRTIYIVIVPGEDQVLLLPIEERVTNVAEQGLAEFALCQIFEAAEVECLESRHACEVNAMGQVHLELLNFFFEVDLVEEQLRHLFSYLALSGSLFSGDFALSLLGRIAIPFSQRHLIVLIILLVLRLILLLMLRLEASALHLVGVFRRVSDVISWLVVRLFLD